MGAQVAAHLVAQGLEVALLDLAATDGDGAQRAGAARPRDPAQAEAVAAPPAARTLARIAARQLRGRPGRQLADADWVFEAVVEDLEVKRQLFARVRRGT